MTILKAIEDIMDENTFSYVLIQGDFNWDSRRDGGHYLVMKEFTQCIGIISVWEKFPVSFTHIHTDLKSASIHDNFLCNELLGGIFQRCYQKIILRLDNFRPTCKKWGQNLKK